VFVVYFDTETGGVLPEQPTIQLAAVAIDQDGDEAGAFEQNIVFNVKDCDPEALKMNHYTAEAWKDAVSPAATAAKFATWLRPFQSVTLTSKRTGKPYNVARLAGYNAQFDTPRLKAMFGASFFPCEYLVRDVLQRALFFFDETQAPKPENFKLSTVCKAFGVDTDGAHGALADARMCAKLHQAIREAF
jgi:DNA polymerase III epsilon subunit-like protein